MRRFNRVVLCVLALLVGGCHQHFEIDKRLRLVSDHVTVSIDPATLYVETTDSETGRCVTVSNAQPGLPSPTHIRHTSDTIHWMQGGIEIAIRIVDGELLFLFTSDAINEVTFPVIGRGPTDEIDANHWLLPIHEGHVFPDDDADWARHLANQSPTNTLEGLSVPFIGLMPSSGGTATWILENPVNNTLEYSGDGVHSPIGLSVTHRFNPVMDDARYGVRFALTGDNPIAPALAYRAYLIEHVGLRTLAQKIADNPRVGRLRGALHAYVWDDGRISAHDLRHAKPIAEALLAAADESEGVYHDRLWLPLDEQGRDAVRALGMEEWPSMYLKRELAAALSRVMEQTDLTPADLHAAFPQHLSAPDTWGNGISLGMIDAMRDAGIDRALLLTSDLQPPVLKPHVSAYANDVGYLFGPYDSYHSIHAPSEDAETTWETAQFDRALWETGGIRNADGGYSAGFKQRGRHLSPLAARPYVEARVGRLLLQAPHSAWFVDCDAFGQLFDDYTPDRMCSKYDDMTERLDRMRWMSEAHGLVVGSEGGSAYAANAIHFAHGMTTPVIGWGDDRLTNRDSSYYLGGWWPPDAPAKFISQVPLAPGYEKIHFDPRCRLPLYQAVFHDCVVATHHWEFHSLKFSDQVETIALTEQLYNTPPLFHLNRNQWQIHGEAIVKRMTFFAPIHREASLLAMTEFRWLDDTRLIQQTMFGQRFIITANYSATEYIDKTIGTIIPPRTVICEDTETGNVTRYTP